MHHGEWGECHHCKHFQVEPDAEIGGDTLGHCTHHELEHFQLRVSGESGCNHFERGTPSRAEGASAERHFSLNQ
jgi:hypothetical protein